MKARIVIKTMQQMGRIIQLIKEATLQEEGTDGRRGHWRLEYGTPGIIVPEQDANLFEPIYVTTRDISLEGVGFFSTHRLRPGQRILITVETDFGDLEVPAKVVHTNGTVGGFKIGAKFLLDEAN